MTDYLERGGTWLLLHKRMMLQSEKGEEEEKVGLSLSLSLSLSFFFLASSEFLCFMEEKEERLRRAFKASKGLVDIRTVFAHDRVL